MWLGGMSRKDMEDFLKEYSDELIDILLDAYGFTVDSIVMDHLSNEAAEWAAGVNYWEVC